jgi:hypothetical protein
VLLLAGAGLRRLDGNMATDRKNSARCIKMPYLICPPFLFATIKYSKTAIHGTVFISG